VSDRRWPWLLGLVLALAGTLWMAARMVVAIWAVFVSLLTGVVTPTSPDWSALPAWVGISAVGR